MIRKSYYDLRKNHAVVVNWLHLASETINVETGKMTNVYADTKVKKAVLLPIKMDRVLKVFNGQFAYGGYYDTNTRLLMVEQKNFPKDWRGEFDANDRVVINGKRYTIANCENYENTTLWLVTIVNVKGTEADNVISQSLTQNAGLNDVGINA
ncbi:MAG TPA: hypothetical protein PLE74_01215 [Candidatus Cloacimonadota bacterium]|nr:hypothetical protein [Candidatus Cloacimonadota bacterium]